MKKDDARDIVFLTSGSEEANVIVPRMRQFMDLGHVVLIQEYKYNKNDLPILITGSGREHVLSHKLSEKIRGQFDPSNLVKVLFDAHDDSTDEILRCDSHIYHTLAEGLVSVVYTNLTEVPSGIYNKKVHLTVDFDFLMERYVASDLINTTEFKQVELLKRSQDYIAAERAQMLEVIKDIAINCEVVALDLNGVSPYSAWRRASNGKLFAYRISYNWGEAPNEVINEYERLAIGNGYTGAWYRLWEHKGIEQIGSIRNRYLQDEHVKEIAPATDKGVQDYIAVIKAAVPSI